MEAQTRTGQILHVMKILAWIALIGHILAGGVVLISYCINWVSPDVENNFKDDLNLQTLRKFNFWYYTLSVSFIEVTIIMK